VRRAPASYAGALLLWRAVRTLVYRRSVMATVDVGPSAYLTADEAARVLRVTPQTLRRALARGDVHGVRVGRVWRVPVDGLEAAAVPKPAYHERTP
jgi:excisionase family DNA binding protein